jgi:hypothetical protein
MSMRGVSVLGTPPSKKTPADEFQGQWLFALPEHQIKVQIRRSPKAGQTH